MFKSAPQPPTSGSTKFGSALLLSQQPLNRDRNRLMSDAIVSEPVLNPARGEQISGKVNALTACRTLFCDTYLCTRFAVVTTGPEFNDNS